MTTLSCGIDFGTSNSSIAIDSKGEISLVPVENASVTIPSAIFFQQCDNKAYYGRKAISLFFEREPGRFMRSLKRVLGTSLMSQGTMVNGTSMNFTTIIAAFLTQLKEKADEVAGQEIESVVMGRPVHFVDNNPAADAQAQVELNAIAQRVGFKHIEFQFEPIAAAFAHEARLTTEKLAIVADLGGGTSDFTVIKLSNKSIHKTDRSSDILANTGVRIGGNDFDKDLERVGELKLLRVVPTLLSPNIKAMTKQWTPLTDSQWDAISPFFNTKRKRTLDLRMVLDAIFYLLRTGCHGAARAVA